MAWLSDWAKRVKLTIDHNDIDAEQTWHHLRVHLSASSGHSSRDISCVFDELESDANRKKIALTKADGTTQLYCEIEKWDHASEQAELWVSRDGWVWSPDVDTDLYLYYDKTKADNITYVGDKGLAGRDGPRENVWDTHFKMVQHANDETTSTVTDSTRNNNDGAKTAANTPLLTTDGLVGDAQKFNINEEITVPDHATLDLEAIYTIEACAKLGMLTSNQGLFSKLVDANHCYALNYQNGTRNWHTIIRRAGINYQYAFPNNTQNDTDWHCIAIRMSGGAPSLFDNGVPYAPVVYGGWAAPTNNDLLIGDYAGSHLRSNAIVDEFRISNISRSAAWIKASYESDRDHLLDFGSEELLVEGSAAGSGIGLSEVTAYLVIPASASGQGIGRAEATAKLIVLAEAIGHGMGIGQTTRAIRLVLNIIRPPSRAYDLGKVQDKYNLGKVQDKYNLGKVK